MLSSCCFFLFTIIDGIFVGHGVGTDALGAINLAMPFVMVVSALFMLTTIGGVTITAIRLGRDDQEGANQAFMHAMAGTLLISTVLCIIGVFFTEPLCRLLGANETYFQMVKDYVFYYSIFLIPSGISMTCQGFGRNDGAPVLVSMAVVIGTVFNIFGDWLLVFPLQMGVKGAAIATGVSQTVTLLIIAFHFILRRGKLHICRFKIDKKLFKKILGRGLPETIAQFATPVTTLLMNYVLLARLGDLAVNAYSIICYVASFSMAIFFGTAEGLQPLFGQSYGAKNREDLKYYFRSGLAINFFGSILIAVVLIIIGGPICKLFGADPVTLDFTVQSMPQYAWGFIIMALNTMISAYLYSTKRTRESVVLNVCRSFVFNSLAITLLPLLFGNGIIWFTFGIAEILTFIVAFILLKYSERNGIVFR